MNSACVASATCQHCLPPLCHPWRHTSLKVRHPPSLTSGSLLCMQRGCPKSRSYRVPSLHPSVLSVTALSSIMPGLQPNPLLSHLSQPLAPAMLNSLLVSEITHHLLSQPHQFFIDLLLDLWSLSQQLGHYSGMQGLGSFPRATAPGFVL